MKVRIITQFLGTAGMGVLFSIALGCVVMVLPLPNNPHGSVALAALIVSVPLGYVLGVLAGVLLLGKLLKLNGSGWKAVAGMVVAGVLVSFSRVIPFNTGPGRLPIFEAAFLLLFPLLANVGYHFRVRHAAGERKIDSGNLTSRST